MKGRGRADLLVSWPPWKSVLFCLVNREEGSKGDCIGVLNPGSANGPLGTHSPWP